MVDFRHTPPPQAQPEVMLSGQLAIGRSGDHLARIAQTLRALERDLITVDPPAEVVSGVCQTLRRSRLQSLDLLIQELAGLSEILTNAAPYLPDLPDPHIDALVEGPRLQTLRCALRGLDQRDKLSETVIF